MGDALQETFNEDAKMKQFVKKPVMITAVQWTGENLRDVIAFTDGPPQTRTNHAGMMWDEYQDLVARDGLKIYSLEGKMNASIGDWIIRGVHGEYYPCKPDIFEKTYEPVMGLVQGLPSLIGQGAEYTRADLAPTDEQVMAHPKVRALVEAADAMLGAVCGDTGFAACVRADTRMAYPWPALDAAEARARAALRDLEPKRGEGEE